ncbi:MAG: DUF839 domain-containing protein [Aromatoleum sp.]|jgi:secreted PhoX family phosphatase|uniref:alkaline phosphatase PhoX n=1 Tax=Aromatoleum sp. TaxID=2307007 RepID=UPI002895DBE3|nr:alkaline phosphatase PhoX [Aromatoleum sp.]MDT3671624.1 DUF839 domain-containing protein [Aromatoleum sp.]
MTHRDDYNDLIRDLTVANDKKELDPHWSLCRRGFLKSGVAAMAAVAVPYSILGANKAHAQAVAFSPDYGPLAPVADEATGYPLLNLPEGFKYWSFGWTGDMMDDDVPTPGNHDGMAVVAANKGRFVLVRNHEKGGVTGSFANPEVTYDPMCDGGTTNLIFAPNSQGKKWASARASISGTIRNCAGGPTPWNSWITCEETTNGLHTRPEYSKQHGYCFDVPAVGDADPVPLVDMGCFSHEAVAVDPSTGIIYETEDSTPSGFYRFIPNVPEEPAKGGRLQMMKLVVAPNATRMINGVGYPYYDTGVPQRPGTTWGVEWVNIDEPDRPFITGTTYGGVVAQGIMQGASSLRRGEGVWYGNGMIYVCSTSGGVVGKGQIFVYDPRRETFSVVYESTDRNVLDNPDNIAWSPRGSLVLCEDGSNAISRMHGLTTDGTIFPFCENNLDFTATGMGSISRNGVTYTTNQRGAEFAGATFQNEWLFVNIQANPGITFAITGPWNNGSL